MDYIFRKSTPNEFESCTDLANLAFGCDFRTLLPKAYSANPVMKVENFIAVGNGIKGLVSVLPEKLTVEGAELKTGYIGSVCTHPDSRHEGLMIKLMQNVNSELKQNGTDIAFLNGSRQRYQYYGFVPAGATYSFAIRGENYRHALKNVNSSGIVFQEIISGSDSEAKARELYISRPVHFDRISFADVCRSYHKTPYAVLRNDRFTGFVVSGRKAEWCDLCFESPDALDMAIKAWMEQNQQWELKIFLPEWERELRSRLSVYAAGMSKSYSVQARIYNFKNVASAFIRLKAAHSNISDGKMEFDIDGEAFGIEVKDGKVSFLDKVENPVKLSGYEANRLMLSPFEYDGMPQTPSGWFPLAVYVAPDSPDAF